MACKSLYGPCDECNPQCYISVKNGCSPFNMISSATIEVRDKDTNALIATGTTNSGGQWAVTSPVVCGQQYRVQVTGPGTGQAPQLVTLTGTVQLLMWTTGRFLVRLTKCCYPGFTAVRDPGRTIELRIGGVLVDSRVTDGSGEVYFPKTTTGSYQFTRPAYGACNASTSTLSVTTTNLCTDQTVSMGGTGSFNSILYTCCGGKSYPRFLFLTDGFGTIPISSTNVSSGVRDHVDDGFVSETWGRLSTSASSPCEADAVGCRNTYHAAHRYVRVTNEGTVGIRYTLSCLDGVLTLKAEYNYRMGFLTDFYAGGYWCRECQDGSGTWVLQHSPGSATPCTSYPVVGSATNTSSNGMVSGCGWTYSETPNWRCGFSYGSGAPLAGPAGTRYATATGTYAIPDGATTLAATFTLSPPSGVTWAWESSPSSTSSPSCGFVNNFMPEPPGGTTIVVTS